MYQTTVTVNLKSVSLHALETASLDLWRVGAMSITPMSNIEIWTGATILLSKRDNYPRHTESVYLVDAEGDTYQLAGAHDTLIYSNTIVDYTEEVTSSVLFMEEVLKCLVGHIDSMDWWNECLQAILKADKRTEERIRRIAIEHALKHNMNQVIVERIKQADFPGGSLVGRVKRLR